MSKPTRDKNIQIPADILKDLLTVSEWRMLKNRFQIMNLLEEGLPIRKVAEKVRVGTDTVVRVARMVKTSPKVKRIKTSTPWIFGKSDE
ncbi:hypothetical protein HYS94_02900 [Candidatus Daviesbacteria bacterium]|nr:hypothetical protein [Candidatus Daviesbacteria bacterium]